MARYRHLLPALRRVGVVFRPMVWSAEGRPHAQTTRMLQAAVRLVRGTKGAEAATELQQRWEHEIAIAIQRRKAAMVRAVLPASSSRQRWIESCLNAREVTLPPLDDDVDAVSIKSGGGSGNDANNG